MRDVSVIETEAKIEVEANKGDDKGIKTGSEADKIGGSLGMRDCSIRIRQKRGLGTGRIAIIDRKRRDCSIRIR
jgi:hypothetical protein